MTAAIPQFQQAAEVVNPGEDFEIRIRNDIPVPEPAENEVLVKLTCTGLCHSEVRAVLNWSPYRSIIGHEGIGTVIKAGPGATATAIPLNTRVGVKWLYSACDTCSLCTRGHHHYCAKQVNTSRHVQGTLQQYVLADARFLTRIPDGVPDIIAAPLLCAGLTMAGALGKLDNILNKGDFIVISGSGGGLGHIGVQIAARVKGLRVIGVGAGPEKRGLSLESGAEVFVDYRTEDVEARVLEITSEGAHASIVVPGTREAFAMAPRVVRNMGIIVCVGLPRNEMELPISVTMLAARGLSIIGSSVGTEEQMDELLQQAAEGIITPSVEVFDFEDTQDLINRLKDDAVAGRVVVKIPA
ncbi:hypothetical protein BDW74DRAFT_180167 [Aspergillus multicolor]|uniref:zinc-dependent alcohol dehydrogenase n=1 Tax=Aspergillus multicolor TaxID=41759 RepID=UPI003CCDF0B9